jgi:hypothetical protein
MVDIKELRIGNIVWAEDETLFMTTRAKIISIQPSHCEWESVTKCNKGYRQIDNYIDLEGLPLDKDELDKCPFVGEVWKKKSLGLDMVGPDGFHDLILGMAVDNSYCAPMIKMGTGDGFTIQHAAEIQKDWAENHPGDPPVKDESFTPMKMGDSICLRPIKYLHQLQNLYWCLTGEELEINL